MKTTDIKQEGLTWLKQQGWKDISVLINFILSENKLEELPYKPHALIEKDKQQFFINFFNKDDYFYSKKFKFYVTGFDWYKYKLLVALADITHIPAAVIFHSEANDKFIFRQLNQLPNPIRWRSSLCLAKQYKRSQEQFKCLKCWRNNPQTAKKCINRKTRGRPMAVWNINNFITKTIYQCEMFTKKYDIPKRYQNFNKRTINSNR